MGLLSDREFINLFFLEISVENLMFDCSAIKRDRVAEVAYILQLLSEEALLGF
jgi:hypothetical protein